MPSAFTELLPPALNERLLQPAGEPGALSGVAAADDPPHQAYVYFPELKGKYQLTSTDLKETRRRSQWLVLNTYARVLRRLARYLGAPEIRANTRDERFNVAVNRYWRGQFRDRVGAYDMSGKFNSATFLTNAIFCAWRDSDCTGIHLSREDGEPTCAAIEANRIDQPWQGQWSDWQDGVLVDRWDRHLAYMVADNPPGVRGQWQQPDYTMVPAGHCHMFGDFESQSSVRGSPALIHCVSNMLSARQIDEGNITLSKIAQQWGILFTSESLSAPTNGVPGAAVTGAKRREDVAASVASTPSTGTTTAPAKRLVTEVTATGELTALPPGVKAQILQSQHDFTAQETIKKDIYVQVALGLGIPVEMLFLLEKLTGPGVRFVLRHAQEWRNYWLSQMQTWQSVDWARRVEWAMRTGRIPKCKDPNFAAHYFQNPKAITIDDGRSMAAMVAGLEAGTTNLTEVWGEKGGDWKEETTQRIQEIAHGLTECRRMGVPPEYYFTKVRPDLASGDSPDGDDEDDPLLPAEEDDEKPAPGRKKA